MRQHRQRYFHAGHRRPSPAVKCHHAARARIRFPQPGARRGRHAAKTRGQDQRRWQEAVSAVGHRPRGRARCAPPQYAGGGTGSRRPRVVSAASAETGRDRAHTTAPPVAASLRRRARGDRVGHRARTHRPRPRRPRRPAARSARPPTAPSASSRTPCMTCRSRPDHRKARNGGPESGICTHAASRSSPSPITRDPASRGAGGARNAPHGHSAGQRNAVPRGQPLKADGASTSGFLSSWPR
jgi:hypothetical protein